MSFFRALIDQIRLFVRNEDGLTMVEYAVAGAVIAAGAYAAFSGLGSAVSTKIGDITTAIGG